MQNRRNFVVWITFTSSLNLAAHIKNRCSFVVWDHKSLSLLDWTLWALHSQWYLRYCTYFETTFQGRGEWCPKFNMKFCNTFPFETFFTLYSLHKSQGHLCVAFKTSAINWKRKHFSIHCLFIWHVSNFISAIYDRSF